MNLVLRGHSSHNVSMLSAVQLEILKDGIHTTCSTTYSKTKRCRHILPHIRIPNMSLISLFVLQLFCSNKRMCQFFYSEVSLDFFLHSVDHASLYNLVNETKLVYKIFSIFRQVYL